MRTHAVRLLLAGALALGSPVVLASCDQEDMRDVEEGVNDVEEGVEKGAKEVEEEVDDLDSDGKDD
ncbi:MAG TPA: hypothetical protein VG929_05735 [Actinomycetota bacterium]|nr:hypothetical protein [Actinomycetota bacterium]